MKKILSFLLLFIIITTITLVFNKPKMVTNDYNLNNITNKVFNDNNSNELLKHPNDYNDVYLLFDEYKLTTNNFIKLFSNLNNSNEIKIKTLYPYFNPLYENNLKHYISSFSFLNNNLLLGINTLYEKYYNVLQDYGYHEEMTKVDIDGIRIRIVLVYVNNLELYNFLNTYPNIKYSYNIDGNYKKTR
jgi:hypothetical protein